MSNNSNASLDKDTVLKLENISLSFGGVNALTNISFDVKEHEHKEQNSDKRIHPGLRGLLKILSLLLPQSIPY